MKTNIKNYILLNVMLIMYSLSSVCSKMAAGELVLGVRFFLIYGLVILLLGVYALGWQQVLKKIPLTVAFANKAITVFWGMVWGFVIFHEKITLGKAAGATLVVLGIVFYALSDKKSEKEDEK